jgi:hypothetical protein
MKQLTKMLILPLGLLITSPLGTCQARSSLLLEEFANIIERLDNLCDETEKQVLYTVDEDDTDVVVSIPLSDDESKNIEDDIENDVISITIKSQHSRKSIAIHSHYISADLVEMIKKEKKGSKNTEPSYVYVDHSGEQCQRIPQVNVNQVKAELSKVALEEAKEAKEGEQKIEENKVSSDYILKLTLPKKSPRKRLSIVQK